MSSVTIVTEDLLSETLLDCIISQIDPDVDTTQRLGRRGIGYIEQRIRSFNRAAAGQKIVVLADRDRAAVCPINTIAEWLGGYRHRNLVVRFAEMEAESWLMADPDPLSAFLDVPVSRISARPDLLTDPKQELVNIARLSRSSRIRHDICPTPGSTIPVGPAYNERLIAFLRRSWSVVRARDNSPSLRKAELRVRELLAYP